MTNIDTDKLKDLRKQSGLTQANMAEFLTVTLRHYQFIEAGQIDLPTSKLISIADRFKCSIDYLTNRSLDPEIHNPTPLSGEEAATLERPAI